MDLRQPYNNEAYRLENNQMQACFNSETGALECFQYKRTGWMIENRPDLSQSFRLVVPLPERLFNIVDGRKQSVTKRELDPEKQQVRFTWDGVQSEHGGWLDICLEAVITLTTQGLSFEMEITNRSPYIIESCAYPYLGDLHKPVSSKSLVRASCSYDHLIQKPLSPQFANERGYWGTEYPVQMVSTPETLFLLILANNQGLYVGCHDTSAQERIEFTFRLIPGFGQVGYVPEEKEIAGQSVRLEFFADHLSFVQPGETSRLLPVIMVPFVGDWHDGADIYRAWRSTWMKQPPLPAWLGNIHSWQQIQMTSWGDSLNIRYNELAHYVDECVEHGVEAVQLVGWTVYGQDGRLPIHNTEDRLGSREDLKSAISYMQERGVKVLLYEKYTCADIGTEWYRNVLHRLTSKDIFGNIHGHEGWRYDTPAHLAGINIRPYAWMCMNSAEWQDIALQEIENSLELEPDGILLDESMWHGSNGFYCFDKSHGHRIPAYNFAGDADFERKLRFLLESIDPCLVLAGEGPYDLQNRHYMLSYLRASDGHIPIIRYIDPYLPMMNWVHGFDDRESINRCLLYRYIISYEPRHFRGKLSEFPATLDYGKKVDSLRKKFKEYLWDAEFQDTRGVSVTVGQTPHPLFSVFQQKGTNRRAVVIANHESRDRISCQAQIEGGEPEFYHVSPEKPEPEKASGNIDIPPRSVAVLLEI